ncbi:MAG: YdcF family protein [Bacillota bacterium]|nr:YdcF family protein [Bacillota bacterium]
MEVIDDFNKIISFLAKRDINTLSANELLSKFRINQADLLIILGSAIPYIAEVGARAYKKKIAKEIMIVGGIGHSTKYLADNITNNSKYKGIDVSLRPEADILKDLLIKFEGISQAAIITENKSKNCGSNAYEALKVIKALNKIPQTVILLQDPTMQLRTDLCFKKEWQSENTIFINYAPFIPNLKQQGKLSFVNDEIYGLWDMDRFISLILREIPRLRDDINGYGPKGKGYINHIDIPEDILSSYEKLKNIYYKQNLRS